MRLKEKVCVITGSSSGIGEAIARGYAKEGAKVVITYNTNKENAEKIAKEVGSELIVHLDVKDRNSIKKAFEEIDKAIGINAELHFAN